MGVLYSKPWREFQCDSTPWSEEHLQELKAAIPEISFPESKGVTKGHIVLIGPTGSGKSSFINSFLGIRKGRIVQAAVAGGSASTMTKQHNKFICGNFVVSDTMGLKGGKEAGINVGDIIFLLKGNIPKDYKFVPGKPITQDSPHFKTNPTNADRSHCVVFCVDAGLMMSVVPPELLVKMKDLKEEITSCNIPSVLIITKIDEISTHVQKDIGHTFKSSTVEQAVRKASEIFEMPEMHIHPVKNFTNELKPMVKSSILLLQALKQAVEFAQDHVQNVIDDNE